jgi:ArsR family transcriptional regulator
MEQPSTAEPPSTSSRIDPLAFERAARVIRVLGHPLRLRILESLETGERNVADLQAELETAQASISQQLAILRSEAVVASRRDGPRVYYRIIEPKVAHILDCIRQCDLPERTDLIAIAGYAVLGTATRDLPDEPDGPVVRRSNP